MPEAKPNNTSSDHDVMRPYWDKVATILGGAEKMRAAGEDYLPKFPNETKSDYDLRRKTAKFTNIFRDIVENLAAKPFSKEVGLSDEPMGRLAEIIEDIDGQGNHLHVFAGATFFAGIAYAVDWILVDHTRGVPENATVAQERAMGARPYWVHIPARKMLAVYSDVVGGTEIFIHARVEENRVERDGFEEHVIERIRVFDRAAFQTEDGRTEYAPATYEIWEKQEVEGFAEKQWVEIDNGPVTIGIIPIIPFLTGRRRDGSWRVIPPLQDAADLQVEHYQQESGLKYAKELTCFPMLAGNGVTPPEGADGAPAQVPVGPKSVLYAPPTITSTSAFAGSWQFIEPDAQSLRFLAEDIKETAKELRELGRQPLTAQSGNLTVVTTAFAAQKGNTAIQAWALNLKDALENALKVTAMWLREDSQPEVVVHTDFDVGANIEGDLDALDKARERRDISRAAHLRELKRRNVLSAEYDAEDDEDLILQEVPGDDDEDRRAAMTPPASQAA